MGTLREMIKMQLMSLFDLQRHSVTLALWLYLFRYAIVIFILSKVQ